MIIGLGLPEGAKTITLNDRILIVFDEKLSTRDLWKARLDLWLTEGNTVEEFYDNKLLNKQQAITITHKNKVVMS